MAIASDKVVIVGTGNVGATAAYAMMLRGLFTDIVLIDASSGRAAAEAIDIADANALARPARIRGGEYSEVRDARVVVLTAGAATHGDETRLSVAGRSAEIVRGCARQIMEAGFDGILVVASNPVDLMAQVAQETCGLPAQRVIGTGTLLDSARFRQRLAQQLDVAPAAVEATVLGEHGDSEVAAFSTVRIGGVALEDFATVDREGIADAVMRAGYTIIQGKGYTSFGVATAIVRICEAIRRDERVVLPVSTRTAGEYGISDLYLSLPCLIGAAGVIRTLSPQLSAKEEEALRRSASALSSAMAALRG
ncbi:L-lactate dehydrogenase [Sphingomonas sp. IC-56]|uniref:L-lactate dehydrogenase n=1 Tax=Sphingomonas sp. IC-56 TaxID=2898529 RepID=UPI001E5C96E6|nr:L-lactate dehydrogenase [Sphingomonas sp. IC-56]MCD2323014.1 L-lactate dehydrogenase [Sphingomonas sp. IC-56]